jgi:hypothetical protein
LAGGYGRDADVDRQTRRRGATLTSRVAWCWRNCWLRYAVKMSFFEQSQNLGLYIPCSTVAPKQQSAQIAACTDPFD